MIDGTYGSIFFGSKKTYRDYIVRQVYRVKRYYKGGKALSIGCGDGAIESQLPFPVVCYDIHDAAKVLHPDLDFRETWPEDEKFDLVICLGGVVTYIDADEQKMFIDRLIQSTNDNGVVLIHGINHKSSVFEIEGVTHQCKWPSHPKVKVL